MLNDNLLTCSLVKVCHLEATKDGVNKFGAKGIVESEDPNVCQFNCSGCYILENNLIPLVHKCHENHARYPKDSLLHYLNTYSYALHLYSMSQDTTEEDEDGDSDDD